MLVSDILQAKGRDVAVAASNDDLRTIAAVMADRRIGAVVIVDAARRVEGIVSERDVVRMIARGGAEALDRPASEAMTRNVTVCRETDDVHYLMGRMTEGRFRHVPVVENGDLKGIVSIGDVVKERLHAYEAETQAMREYITTA